MESQPWLYCLKRRDTFAEWLSLEVTSGGHLVQPACSNRTISGLPGPNGTLALVEGDLGIVSNFLGTFPFKFLCLGPPPSSYLELQSPLPKSSAVILFFPLLCILNVLSFTLVWSLWPRLPLTFTSLLSPSLLVSISPVEHHPHFSITCGRKLSSVLSRNLSTCLCPSLAPPADIRMVKVPHEDESLQRGGCFYLSIVRLIHLFFLVNSRHSPPCHSLPAL